MTKERSAGGAVRPDGEVPPWTILAGLGAMERHEICHFLSLFENATLLRVALDRISDVRTGKLPTKSTSERSSFLKRLEETANNLGRSELSDGLLRACLWEHTQVALSADPVLPLSTRSACIATAKIARDVVTATENGLVDIERNGSIRRKIRQIVSKRPERTGDLDFSEVVRSQAAQIISEMFEDDALSEESAVLPIEEIRSRIAASGVENAVVEAALRRGDVCALALLASGTSLAGIALAVELAGFSAYALAAQASAIIPLLSGKAAVSGLFVLSNPIFIVPALIGGGVLAHKGFATKIRRGLAASFVLLSALRGLAAGRRGLDSFIDGLRETLAAGPAPGRLGRADAYTNTWNRVCELVDRPIPLTAGQPPRHLGRPLAEEYTPAFFIDRSGDKGNSSVEILSVAALTYGDVLYTVAAIDPRVVQAIDFSRSEDLSSLLCSGAFANRMEDLSGASLAGAENNLRGYVAEQFVAASLTQRGHQVDLPESSNNPGYDLVVDGEPVQIKCVSSMDSIRRHFQYYQDVPVIVNSELAKDIYILDAPWANNVFFLEDFNYATIDRIMGASVEALAHLDDLQAPVFAVAVSVAKSLAGWWQGRVPLADLPMEVALSAAIKGGLAASGGLAGKVLGYAVLGPAGALVLGGAGSIGALMGSGVVRRRVDAVLFSEWREEIIDVGERFLCSLMRAITAKKDILKQKIDKLPYGKCDEIEWVRARLIDDLIFLSECLSELEGIKFARNDWDGVEQAFRIMHEAAVHPVAVRRELVSLTKVLKQKPELNEVALGSLRRGADWSRRLLRKLRETR